MDVKDVSVIARLSPHRICGAAAWTAGVMLLMALILLAGVVAFVAVPTMILSRRVGVRIGRPPVARAGAGAPPRYARQRA